MAVVSSCLDVEVLKQFLTGQCAEQDAAALEEHLLQCDRCAETVNRLMAEDPMAEMLRRPRPVAAEEGEGEPVKALINRLCRLQGNTDAPAAEATAAGTPPETPLESVPHRAAALAAEASPASAAVTRELYQFLAPSQAPDELGRLGPYRVLRVLGTGGMGVVFQAEDPRLRRSVALKVMKPDLAASGTARQRFLREAQTTAALEHDHIISIYQVDEDRGVPFLAMPLLKGETLEARLRRESRLPLSDVVRIGREIAEGLAAAHEHGLIHRDIKPSNIWLEIPAGESVTPATLARVKLLDFGLARAVADDAHLTHSGAIAGTPQYMAPEQAKAEPVDARCDLFGLGCVLYRMLTGQLAFKGSKTMEVLRSLELDQPTPPRTLNPEVSPALSSLVMQLLAKRPANRPASASDVVAALSAIEREPARVPNQASRPRRWNRWAVAAACLFVAAALAMGAVVYVKTDRGTLQIDTQDDTVKVIVEQGGKQVMVIDTKTGTEVTLASGDYTLRPAEDRKDIDLAPDHVTLKRGGTVVATIKRLPKPPGTPALAPIDEVWFRLVATLPAEKQVDAVALKMRERNPDFDGKLDAQIVDGKVWELRFLTDEVTDIAAVRALVGLRQLACSGSAASKGKLADLTPLKGMSLNALACHFTRVSDLTPLKGMPLRVLQCTGTQVPDLSPLEGMPLEKLDCGATPLSDLTPLKGMRLQHLDCSHTRVSDWSPLEGMPLLHLNCCNTTISDLNVLKGMPLADLNLSGTPVSDLSPLQGMKLKYLHCYNTFIRDLEPLQGMPLTNLSCSETKISDLSPLKGMPLVFLNCWGTNISSLAPLQGMRLETLDCASTQVSDLSPLKGMPLTYLVCGGTKVTDLTPLRGMPLKLLGCDFQPERDTALLRSLTTLKSINQKPAAEFWKEVEAKESPRQP
jgi:serine/threonine protein kinase/Leucine-rich repeat (LRR) protein